MKRLAVLMLAALVFVGCGDDDPTGPSPDANRVVFTAALSAANEVPAVTNAESVGRGSATITMNLTRNASNQIQSGTIDFQFTVNSFPAGSVLTLAHIHTGAAGVAGPILVNTGLSAATAIAVAGGNASFEARGISADATTLQSIIDNPANFYFNVHSQLNPSGVVRAQLVRQ